MDVECKANLNDLSCILWTRRAPFDDVSLP